MKRLLVLALVLCGTTSCENLVPQNSSKKNTHAIVLDPCDYMSILIELMEDLKLSYLKEDKKQQRICEEKLEYVYGLATDIYGERRLRKWCPDLCDKYNKIKKEVENIR